MAEEDKLIEELSKRRKRFGEAGMAAGLGSAPPPPPKPNPEADAGAPAGGWRGALGNMFEAVGGKKKK